MRNTTKPRSPKPRLNSLLILVALLALLLLPTLLHAQVVTNWVAYNDHGPTASTAANVTPYSMRGTSLAGDPASDHPTSGFLTNFMAGSLPAGQQLPVRFVASTAGAISTLFANAAMGNPDAGTPAYAVFNGIVDLANAGSSIGLQAGQDIILTFTNLDPGMFYSLRATAIRAGTIYGANHPGRWTYCEIQGADSFTDAHSAGCLTSMTPLPEYTNPSTGTIYPALNLSPGQAILQTGMNTQGNMFGWDAIRPGADGSFSIVTRYWGGVVTNLYLNFAPAPPEAPVTITNAFDNLGYAPNAFRLIEYGPLTPVSIVTQPADPVSVMQKRSFSLSVTAFGTAPQYQWYREATGPIAGANLATFSIASSEVSDSGNYYVVVHNSQNMATSTVAHVTVAADVTPPQVASVVGSGTFDHLTITFSERLDLSAATEASNYEIVGQPGAVISAAISDPGTETVGTTVVLTTAVLAENTDYQLTVGFIADLAGNFIDPNVVYPFKTWVTSPASGLLFETFSGTARGPIDNIPSEAVGWPDNPRFSATLSAFDSRVAYPDDSHEDYVSRTRGLFIPPVSGNWVFFLRSDDPGRVFLNPNGPNAAGKQQILDEPGCCGDWNKYMSPSFPLQAGHGYYIEALNREYGGGDYIKVAARLAGTGFPVLGTANNVIDPAAIAGDAIGYPAAPAGVGGDITITQQPVAIMADENQMVTFSVGVSNPNNLPVVYQWYRDAVEIPGETKSSLSFVVGLPDDGVHFSVQAAIIGSKVLSSEALLTVVSDIVPPTVVSVTVDQTFTNVYIRFDELMNAASAEEVSGYDITGPGPVFPIAGHLLADGVTLQLALDVPMQPDTDYTIAINSAQDLAGNPVASGTSVPFHTWKLTPGFVTFQTYNTPVNGTTVDLLTSSPDYPDNPRETFYITSFDTRDAYPTDAHEQYGGRLYGLFTPNVSGNWIFYLRSDDSSELYLNSAGIDAGGAAMITSQPGCCEAFSAHQSAPIALEAGHSYFLEALYKEGGGGDYCQVAAKLDTDPANPDTLSPISSSLLRAIINPAGISVGITSQPTDQVGVLSSPGQVLYAQDFNSDDGGFTVENSPTPPAGPWTYNAGKGTWSANGGEGVVFSKLDSPTMTVTVPGSVVLTLNHRYSFEFDGTTRWDAGQIRLSVNGGPYNPVDATNFTANGYKTDKVIGGNNIMNNQYAFNDTSDGWAGGTFIQSIVTLGNFSPGDQLSLQFAGGWDEGTVNPAPNWEIDKLVVAEGVVPLYSEDFVANDGGFTVINTNNPAGPWVYNAGRGTWSADGGEGIVASLLSSPDITVSKDGFVRLTFRHRYNFEDGTTEWDGGEVRVSMNGSPYVLVPPENFSTNGYAPGLFVGNGFIKGLPGFNGQSADYTNSFIKSVAALGAFHAGDMLSVQFAGSWDDGFIMPPPPNWEIDSLSLEDGIAVPVTFSVEATAVVPGATVIPIAYQWQKDSGAGFVDIPGATGSSLTFFVVEADNGTRYRCVVSVPGASVTSDSALLTIGGEARPTVSITRGNGTVTIEWSSGTLQSAPTVLGPWTDLPAAVSPHTIPAAGPGTFFRVSQ